MKNWFCNLDKNKRNVISVAFSVVGLVFTIIGYVCYYFLIVGVPALIIGLIFLNWNDKLKKEKNEIVTDNTNNIKDDIEFQRYNLLKQTDFSTEKAVCNFECSLKEMALKQIVANKYFNSSDFDFNVDERINEYKAKGLSFFMNSKCKNFVALDIETTGLDAHEDRIIQVAMVKVLNGEIKDTYCKLVNPQKHISLAASEVNGLYDVDVKKEKTIKQIFPEIFAFIDDLPIVAHNAKFDMGFLRNEWYRCFEEKFPKHKDICTLELWKSLYIIFQNETPDSSKLGTLVQLLLDDVEVRTYNENKHDALCDASATAKVFMKLYDDNYKKLFK